MNRIPKPLLLLIGLLAAYFTFLAFLIFRSNYVMMDTVWTVWHHPEPNTVFHHWSIQGRALGGCWLQWLFGLAGKISNVRFIRLVSWAGWVGFCALLFRVLRRVWRSGGLESGDWVIRLTVVFAAACLSVVLYIGWANCSEIFIPAILSLWAGLILFEGMYGRATGAAATGAAAAAGVTGGAAAAAAGRVTGAAAAGAATNFRLPLWRAGLALVLGVLALFSYQTCYPFLLLPFYCVYLNRKDGKLTRPMLVALFFFFAGLVLYYIAFRYSLRLSGFQPSERTALGLDPLNRLSFFFSYPMNQAFNLNFFFNTKSALSQIVFPVLMGGWVLFTFLYRRGRASQANGQTGQPAKGQTGLPAKGQISQQVTGQAWIRLRYILGMIFWWMLGYLPQLIAQESEGPYRTMPVLSLMVFLMMADWIGSLIKEGRQKMLLSFALILILLVRGGYVYYSYISGPYSEEYRAVRAAVADRYNSRIKKVIFVLADENGFMPRFGVAHFKDEFAMPSIHKDWTPEPLIKQIVYEMTGDRGQADKLEVTVYEKTGQIPDRMVLSDPAVLFIDAHTLF